MRNDHVVKVGPWMVDKFENSICSCFGGKTICNEALLKFLKYESYQQLISLNGERGVNEVFAVSVPDQIPATGLNWVQASALCLLSHKQIIPDHLWLVLARGEYQAMNCNVRDQENLFVRWLRPTGGASFSKPPCMSYWGIHDMVGNAWEWTSETNLVNSERGGGFGLFIPNRPQSFLGLGVFFHVNGVVRGLYNEIPPSQGYGVTSAILRGGSFNSDSYGPDVYTLSVSANYKHPEIGFRCVSY